ncbi:MlaE family ABC transporter permease [Breznakiella homolactica]|uniref:ABC transporter permease n=1 Tax=Breznakiella homolactica TaxID=2798577 RepID=A0A7T8B9Q5_9SPIR|nr:ABC transporter permease [Breznakiella homolactica]QQO09859.1 ABC transporter permease [Breznakiella homolactica]
MRQIIVQTLTNLGRYFDFVKDVILSVFRRPFRINQFVMELEHLGVNSIAIIFLSGGAIGMIIALQMVALLLPFQAEIGTGAAVAVAMGRELAPIITTLMLIAKNGSAMAAELGTMRVTEQIDALESMAVSPVHYLVLPKVIASVVVFPVLTLLANVVGTLGSLFISVYLYGIDSAVYTHFMFDMLSPRDIYTGMIKSAIMGFMVATICCYKGLNTTQGAKGVGDSATSAVVTSSVAILVADYILASLML